MNDSGVKAERFMYKSSDWNGNVVDIEEFLSKYLRGTAFRNPFEYRSTTVLAGSVLELLTPQ